MPQFTSDEHPYYQNFQRKQIVIWSVLLVIVLGVSGSLFYFSYYLFGGGENRAGVINQPTAKSCHPAKGKKISLLEKKSRGML